MDQGVKRVDITLVRESLFRLESPDSDRWALVELRDWPEGRVPSYLITRSDGVTMGGEMYVNTAYGYAVEWIRSA